MHGNIYAHRYVTNAQRSEFQLGHPDGSDTVAADISQILLARSTHEKETDRDQ